eukprot:4392311-Pyramimonas_sp.AAC.1
MGVGDDDIMSYIRVKSAVLGEVPAKLLDATKWDTALASQVVVPGNILGLEGDAAVLAVRHALRSSRNLGAKPVLIVDNL